MCGIASPFLCLFLLKCVSIICFKCPDMFRASCNQRDPHAAPIRARLGHRDGENSILPHHIKHSFTYTLARATYGPQGRRFYECICSLEALKHTLMCAIVQGKTFMFSVCEFSEIEEGPHANVLACRYYLALMHYHTVADCTLFNSITYIIATRFIWLVFSLQNIYRYISITLTFRLLGPDY